MKRRVGLAVLAGAAASLLAIASCGGGGGGGTGNAVMPSNTIDTRTVNVSSSMVTPAAGVSPVKATVLADGLHNPWGLAFLPDGRMLVTQRDGTLLLVSVSGNVTTLSSVPGVPPVYAQGQGGLLDVQVDPLFSTSEPWIYWTYAEAGTGVDAGKAGTAVARGRLVEGRLQDVTVIFRQKPKMNGSNHFGSRLVFRGDGTLFVTLGERQADSTTSPTADFAQNLSKDLGKVVRINKDGTPAAGNPNWGVAGALPEIWSTGHRNPQGAALNPATGDLWVSEHGPQGGDEVNLALAGRNFGWPLRSYGCPYEVENPGPACQINGGTHAPDFIEPLTYWVPKSTAPSGMVFYTGIKLPEWQGKLLLGALSGQSVWRLTLSGNTVLSKDELFKNAFGRIRDVRQGPDGWLYLLVDDARNGRLIRIER